MLETLRRTRDLQRAPALTPIAGAGLAQDCPDTLRVVLRTTSRPVPATPPLSPAEIEGDYEANTGHAIVRRFHGIDPMLRPAVLVAGHAPFTWGESVAAAAHTAVVLEEVAQLALQTLAVNPNASPISQTLLDKHFYRKHGPAACYGQEKKGEA